MKSFSFDKSLLVSLYETTEAQLNAQAAVFGLSPENLEKYFVSEPQYDMAMGAPMEKIFERLLLSLQNRQNKSASIRFHLHIDEVKAALCNFDVKQIAAQFADDDADEHIYKLLAPICQWNPKADSPRLWCQGLIQGARQLAKFNGPLQMHIELAMVDPLEMADYWMKHYRIKGMGYALTCDFLKEIGFNLPKADTHIIHLIDSVFPEHAKLCKTDKDYTEVFLAIVEQLNELKDQNLTAYKLDKMIWLVCTNSFYLDLVPGSLRDNLVNKILCAK